MAPPITQVIDVRVRFVVAEDTVNGYGEFSDGLYYDDLPEQSQVTADQIARYTGHVANLIAARNAPPTPPPTDEELVATVNDNVAQATTALNQMTPDVALQAVSGIVEIIAPFQAGLEAIVNSGG